MAEYGIPYSLETPAGTLTFNVYDATNGYIRLSNVSGLDSPAIRTAISNKPQRDGAIVQPSFLGARSVVLEGQIVPGATLTTRRVLEDNLRAALISILRADGTLKWTPTGITDAGLKRQLTVRLLDGISITTEDNVLKKFQVALIAADPLVYGQTAFTSATGTSGSGGQVHVYNSGTLTSYPTVLLYGPATSPIISNNTYSEGLNFSAAGGLTIASGSWLYIDLAQEQATISIFDGSWLKMQYLNISASDWWGLRPGDNVIRLTAAGGGSVTSATFTVSWRDAYA